MGGYGAVIAENYPSEARSTAENIIFGTGRGLSGFGPAIIGNNYYFLGKTNSYLASSSTDTTTNQLLLTGQNSAGTMSMFKNGSTIASSATTLIYSTILDSIGGASGNFSNSNLQEAIFYNSDEATNRTGIESNINTFYSIYP